MHAPISVLLMRLRCIPLEAYLWTAGLGALACTDPAAEGLLDVCIFRWIGLAGCPGCGLGHAVAYLLQGAVAASWAAHPLGLPATALLIGRVVALVRDAFTLPPHLPP